MIGATARARGRGRRHAGSIFGYTLLNDVSARDVQFKDNQITLGKNFDGFAPIGPCIVTADAMPHPDTAPEDAPERQDAAGRSNQRLALPAAASDCVSLSKS